MESILRKLKQGEISIEEAKRELDIYRIKKIEDFARIDVNRLERKGIPEIIIADGKNAVQIARISAELAHEKGYALITRIKKEDVGEIKRIVEESRSGEFEFIHNEIARTLIVKKRGHEFPAAEGKIGIVAAGTADIPVAEEAGVMLEIMGCKAIKAYDVGIAGLHRIKEPLEKFLRENVSAIIAVAGREGALPSVISSMVDVPVIGVPTSEGYGAGGDGHAALLSMLQSCSLGLAVVNIDNGIGAGAFAALIAKMKG